MVKTALLYSMVAFYLVAGINHFVNPNSYYGLFPPYLKPYAVQLNIAAGIAEVALGLLLLFPAVRPLAGYGIILMLVAFIPSHVYMIQMGTFPMFGFNVSPAISMVRLVVFQPLLAYWAYYVCIKP